MLAPDGRVLARLDPGVTVEHVNDPLIAQALQPGLGEASHLRLKFRAGPLEIGNPARRDEVFLLRRDEVREFSAGHLTPMVVKDHPIGSVFVGIDPPAVGGQDERHLRAVRPRHFQIAALEGHKIPSFPGA